jgi:hypothetical protein
MNNIKRFQMLFMVGLFVGCRTTSTELLEAELRTRNREIRELREKLDYLHSPGMTPNLDCPSDPKTIQAIPLLPSAQPQNPNVSEGPALKAMRINSSRIVYNPSSSGIDRDRDGFDDAFELLFSTVNSANLPVPITGTLEVEARNPDGIRIAQWYVDSKQLQASWQTSLFGKGYRLPLTWSTSPKEPRMELKLILTDESGERLTTTALTSIRIRN